MDFCASFDQPALFILPGRTVPRSRPPLSTSLLLCPHHHTNQLVSDGLAGKWQTRPVSVYMFCHNPGHWSTMMHDIQMQNRKNIKPYYAVWKWSSSSVGTMSLCEKLNSTLLWFHRHVNYTHISVAYNFLSVKKNNWELESTHTDRLGLTVHYSYYW